MSQVLQDWLDIWYDLGNKKYMGTDVLVALLKQNSYFMVILCATRLNIIKTLNLPTGCVCMFFMYLRTNSDFPLYKNNLLLL
jgi:hypothetical protein